MFDLVLSKYRQLSFQIKALEIYIKSREKFLPKAKKSSLENALTQLTYLKNFYAACEQAFQQPGLKTNEQALRAFEQQLQAALKRAYEVRKGLSSEMDFAEQSQVKNLLLEFVGAEYSRLYFERQALAIYIFAHENLLSQTRHDVKRKRLLVDARAALLHFKMLCTEYSRELQQWQQLNLGALEERNIFNEKLSIALAATRGHREKLSDWTVLVGKEQAESFQALTRFLRNNKNRKVFGDDIRQAFQMLCAEVLRQIFGGQYGEVRQVMEEISLSRQWLGNLAKLQGYLSQQYGSREDIFHAMVSNEVPLLRSAFDVAFYAKQSAVITGSECLLVVQELSFDEGEEGIDLLERLKTTKDKLRVDVETMENTLKPTDTVVDFAAHVGAFWKQTPHFAITSVAVDAAIRNLNAMTEQPWMKHIPILREEIAPELLTQLIQIVIPLVSVAWFLYDCRSALLDEANFLFLSLAHVNSLLPLSTVASMAASVLAGHPEFLKSVGVDRRMFTTQVLPWLQPVFSTGAHVFFQCMSKGFSWSSGLNALLGYTFASEVRNYVSAALSTFYEKTAPLEKHNQGVGTLLTNQATFMGATFLWHQLSQQGGRVLTEGWEKFAFLGRANTELSSNDDVLNHASAFNLSH